MGIADKMLWYIFVLSLVLIGVVYYVGVQTDAGAFASFIQTVGYMATGRKKDGTFAAYPGQTK